jgi:hypothetical protein
VSSQQFACAELNIYFHDVQDDPRSVSSCALHFYKQTLDGIIPVQWQVEAHPDRNLPTTVCGTLILAVSSACLVGTLRDS